MAVRLTDERFIVRDYAGERDEFSTLIAQYTPMVFNLVYRFTQDRMEAENLSQETFLRAWRALPRLKPDLPFKPYLLQIAMNLCRDWARKNRRRWNESVDIDDAQDWLADESDDAFEQMTESELRSHLRTAIDQLPPMYRAVITLRYTEGLSYEDIALALELPVNTVRTHLRRAKARLRACLEEA